MRSRGSPNCYGAKQITMPSPKSSLPLNRPNSKRACPSPSPCCSRDPKVSLAEREFNMLSRRQFMHCTSLVSLCPLVPSLLSRIANASTAEPDAKILVVIQLDGGNDGINTVVPFGDDAYARNRTALRLDTTKLHKLNDHVGLHPQMKAAKELFDDGRLTIVQGVG